jgi:hypothetical protein
MNLPLTSEQSAKLIKISGEFQSKQVSDADAGDIRFHQHIKSYLNMLCLAGELQTNNQSGALAQVAYQERKATRLAFDRHFKRAATAQDILNEIAQFVTVPQFLANLISEDFDLLAGVE